MRGEDEVSAELAADGRGSPPHARGRLQKSFPYSCLIRITPACAGKTVKCVIVWKFCGDHPRMRGEDSISS